MVYGGEYFGAQGGHDRPSSLTATTSVSTDHGGTRFPVT
jgi:hypothetical protein